MNIRWKRWIAGAAGLLAIYTVAGFWLLPLVIKNQLPKLGETELARQATVGALKFNPFSLRLEAQDLRLAEADGAPLFAIGQLTTELQWKSLIRRAWSFAEIRITAPYAQLAIAPDGKFNLAELLTTLKHRRNDNSDDTRMPRLLIERFALEQGKVEVRDRRAGYQEDFFPIDLALNNFSTLPGHNGTASFSADSELGGKLRWEGEASLNPIRGSGKLTIENATLPPRSAYLKPITHATVAGGQLGASLPYRFSYEDQRFEASLAGATLVLRDLALTSPGTNEPFATLTHMDVNDINVDLRRREATVGAMRSDGGTLAVRRDDEGEFDLAKLIVKRTEPAAPSNSNDAVDVNNWKLQIKQIVFDQMAINVADESVSPPQKLTAGKARLQLQALAQQDGMDFKLAVSHASMSVGDVALMSGSQTPLKLAKLGFSDGAFDLAARRVRVGRLFAEDGQLDVKRDLDGRLNILGRIPTAGAAVQQAARSSSSAGTPWTADVRHLELSKLSGAFEDKETGIKLDVQDLAAKLEGASLDLTQRMQFDVAMSLREGGQLSAQGGIVRANNALDADVQVKKVALAPLQPLLRKYVKLNIASGNASTQGRLTTSDSKESATSLRYTGGFEINNVALDEDNGKRFGSLKSVRASKLTATLSPNLLEIPELRLVEPNSQLIINADRSINAARLLVEPAVDARAKTAQPPTKTQKQAINTSFPVRIQRVRVQNAKLDFADLSLTPQFSAKIYELNGVITGISTTRNARSQVTLDGRVDEFGLVRIAGNLNPFAPRDNTDVNAVFKNVDMVATTPYAMKFAGYKIKEGKISLDLQYKVRNNQLAGDNQIVIDNLTLGERVDSPDALKLPLELAIAILKDSNGRIDLGLPVSGDLSDPQFSYGAVVWKAVTSLLTKIVTAPFRAISAMFGGSGEKLEAIVFDPGSERLLPPEREKLKQVAQMLSKRSQLKLSVPAQYSEEADGAALKQGAVRTEIAKRADIKLENNDELGPMDMHDRAVRGAVRELYAERFGTAELDKQKLAAESSAPSTSGSSAPSSASGSPQAALPVWQRVGKFIQGEPQVADSSAFYDNLQKRLYQDQPLPVDALSRLGTQRANAILAALKEDGVDPASAHAAGPEKISSEAGKSVPLQLGLAAK